MKLKRGVKIAGLKPEMAIALMVIEPILKAHGQELVMTSAMDSKHSKTSRHYIGFGIDVRSRDVPVKQKRVVEKKLIKALGTEFYVVYEKDHYHIQFNGSQRV